MDKADLDKLKAWFSKYVQTFYSPSEEDQKNIILKEEHSLKVCENMVVIAREQKADHRQLLLSEAIGLFHDIGRFPQYKEFRTFRDNISVNHGKLGAKILAETLILKDLPPHEQELIISSVHFHNTFAIPSLGNPEAVYFLKLIRDADKLDILRVFSEYYEAGGRERASAVNLDLPDTPAYSNDILLCLHERRMASLRDLGSLNDFKLMQLSWIYDLNFPASFRLLGERNYLNRIASTLPLTSEIKSVCDSLTHFISLKGGSQEAR